MEESITGKVQILEPKTGIKKDGTPYSRPQFIINDINGSTQSHYFSCSNDRFAQLQRQGLVNDAIGKITYYINARTYNNGNYFNDENPWSFYPVQQVYQDNAVKQQMAQQTSNNAPQQPVNNAAVTSTPKQAIVQQKPIETPTTAIPQQELPF